MLMLHVPTKCAQQLLTCSGSESHLLEVCTSVEYLTALMHDLTHCFCSAVTVVLLQVERLSRTEPR